MSSFKAHKDPIFIDFCQQNLIALLNNVKGINAAVVATIDGFEITSVFQGANSNNAERLCAIGSSLLALSMSTAEELALKSCHSLEIDGECGRIWISSVTLMDTLLVLLIQVNTHALQGELVFNAKKTQRHIEAFTQ